MFAVKPTAGEPAELSRVRSKNSNKAIGSAFTFWKVNIAIGGILSLRETPKSGHFHGAGLTWLTSPAISATDSFVEAALRRPVEKCLPWPGSVELVVVRSAPVQAVRLTNTV